MHSRIQLYNGSFYLTILEHKIISRALNNSTTYKTALRQLMGQKTMHESKTASEELMLISSLGSITRSYK